MAIRNYALNDAETVKVWAKKLFVESLKDTSFDGLWGEDDDNLIQLKTETQKGKGDKITTILRMIPTGAGVSEGEAQEGNEEALTTYTDSIIINELSHALRVPGNGTIHEQRVPFEPREQARKGLGDWWTDRMDTSFFNQIAGNTLSGLSVKYTGMNAATAPTNQIWTESGATVDSDLDSTGDDFTTATIDRCVARAVTSTPRMRPCKIKGYRDPLYVMFIHPYQAYSLRQSAATAGSWMDIQKAAVQGGQTSDNPIFKSGNTLGIWNNTLIIQNTRVPLGVDGSSAAVASTRRAVFCGAQAAVLAFGMDNGPTEMTWVEELFDYKRQLGVSARSVWGLKKTKFNSADFSVIVASSYAAQP
jgi:N4-gp56 family major capsid protein